MPKTKIAVAISALILTTLACNALLPLPQQDGELTPIVEPIYTQSQGNLPLTEADVPRVSIEAANVAFDSGAAIFVDVRSADAYAASHVAGALNIPLNGIEADPANVDLDKDQWIITYCT